MCTLFYTSWLLAWSFVSLCSGAPAEDEVTSLPGLNFQINFRQYSGYLDGGGGRQLHYWFVESQNEPATDPVVLWLTGGPGCSSLIGFLAENGPFHVLDDGSALYNNTYSWNTIANVIYLESPAGVGFSYNTEDIPFEDDDTTSLQNYLALQDFFTNKFPEYANNEFYITGESYGGIYVPTLSQRVVNGSYPLNFQGFAIGNAYLHVFMNDRSEIFYIYYHGLGGEAEWNTTVSVCCQGVATLEGCLTFDVPECQEAVYALFASAGPIDRYNILKDAGSGMLDRSVMMEHEASRMVPSVTRLDKKNVGVLQANGTKAGYILWLRRSDVREALHVSDNASMWHNCNDALIYNQTYTDMTPQFNYLLQQVRAVLYNGDLDTVCNFIGDQWFAEQLNREVTEDYRAWYVNDQVAGFAKSWDNLHFLTVKGSGHLVPEDQPEVALHLFKKFLNNGNF
jgi:cathepsin A (carboxypeptidase C)